jgi:hypothetical protein
LTKLKNFFAVADISDNILEVGGEKWLRWFGQVRRTSVNKFPRRIFAWPPEGTNKERPELRWGEYDGVGLTSERYMWKNLVLGEEKSFHIGKSLDELNKRKAETENYR